MLPCCRLPTGQQTGAWVPNAPLGPVNPDGLVPWTTVRTEQKLSPILNPPRTKDRVCPCNPGTLGILSIFIYFCISIVDLLFPVFFPLPGILLTQEILEEYNESNTRMNLVLFDDALEHLTRVHRIVRMDRGHALLVGVGGSGKQSLARLAAFTAGYEVRCPPPLSPRPSLQKEVRCARLCRWQPRRCRDSPETVIRGVLAGHEAGVCRGSAWF